MKKLNLNFALITLSVALLSAAAARADSPTDAFLTPNTSLLKGGNWSTTVVPALNVTGTIADGASANPLGWNTNSFDTTTVGDLDFISGSTNLVVGEYTTKTTVSPITITLAGSTLNSQANTILANSSGSTIVFENDVAPSGDLLSESGLTTLALGSTTNFIQAGAGSNIIIDNVVTGTSAALTFLGGGTSSTAGGVLELGAGSANDVVGGVAGNAPTKANGGNFSGTAVAQTGDKNSFTGGLTIGDVGGVANAGTVKIDGTNALPTTGAVTVNANSQLILNGSATYGGTGQTVTLNGTGTGGNANGALTTGTADTSTLQTTVGLGSTTAVNVQGTSKLTLSGQVTGSGPLQSIGIGTLTLSGGNNYSGGTSVKAGSVVAANAGALGSGGVTVSGGALSSSIATSVAVGGPLSLSSGSIAINSAATPTFQLASAQNFTMTGGTLSLTDNSGVVGSIGGLTGSFSISGGTLNLNNSFTTPGAYALSYDVLTGFTPGSVSNLSIINYDSADYTANLSDAGVLSFSADAVPEPGTWALVGLGSLLLVWQMRRRGAASL